MFSISYIKFSDFYIEINLNVETKLPYSVDSFLLFIIQVLSDLSALTREVLLLNDSFGQRIGILRYLK